MYRNTPWKMINPMILGGPQKNMPKIHFRITKVKRKF